MTKHSQRPWWFTQVISEPLAETYRLTICVNRPLEVSIGALGVQRLAPGSYYYTGSAKQHMAARLRRHLLQQKRKRWHIDYILAEADVYVSAIELATRHECALNQSHDGACPIPGLGASDCRQGCGSHFKWRAPLDTSAGVQPGYWPLARFALASTDPVLAAIIERVGADAAMRSRGDPFFTLLRSIVGQQISVKAADAIWRRVQTSVVPLTVANLAQTCPEQLCAAGLSQRKASYMIELAQAFASGRIQPNDWAIMDDETLIKTLSTLRGVGRWTAEMLLMFNLLRPDVLPLADKGLLNGIGQFYGADIAQDLKQVEQLGEQWRPWRSVATWYLWRALDPVDVDY